MKNFSETYYGNKLTKQQHKANNIWFKEQIENCKVKNKKFYIPELRTDFDFDGEPIKYNYIVSDLVSGRIA